MELVLLLARLLLATVFLLAGAAKYADPNGTLKAMRDFGLPRVLAALLSMALPVVEAGVAVALIPLVTAWYAACAALTLLGIFILAIGVNLARGRKPDCHCFGQLHSKPVGWPTLARNGALAAIAGWLVIRGQGGEGPGLVPHLAAAGTDERRFFIFGGFVLAFLFWRALRSRPAPEPQAESEFHGIFEGWLDSDDKPEAVSESRPAPVAAATETPAAATAEPPQSAPAPDPALSPPQTAPEPASAPPPAAPLEPKRAPAPAPPKPSAHDPELQKVLEAGTGWPIGTRAPDFALPALIGGPISLQSIRHQGKSICLVFSSPHCDPCRALWPYISKWATEIEPIINVFMISRDPGATEKLARQYKFDLSRVLLQRQFEISDSYGVRSTPAVLLVGTDGSIQSELAVGREEIYRLLVAEAKRIRAEQAKLQSQPATTSSTS